MIDVRKGHLPVNKAIEKIRHFTYLDLGFAKIDIHRRRRIGIEEVIYGEGKSPRQILSLARVYMRTRRRFLMTRLNEEKIRLLRRECPPVHSSLSAHMAWYRPTMPAKQIKRRKDIAVITAGTSDYPVAVEVCLTLKYLGHRVTWMKDCGVAGIQRLLTFVDTLKKVKCAIAVAGMEGALPTVVSGLCGKPVIAVPTSTGYGVAAGGQTALHTMLSTCSPTVAVVNIDNGFGAACFADAIIRQIK